MNGTERKDLLDAVKVRYGSLDEPDYSFVEQVVQDQPYARLVRALSELAKVEETTDVNNDVSFRYVLHRGGESWGLNLSMVGPYGLVLRLGPEREVLTDEPVEGDELRILRLVKDAGITLLSRKALVDRIPFQLLGDETGHATLYQALIGDDPLPPWEQTT